MSFKESGSARTHRKKHPQIDVDCALLKFGLLKFSESPPKAG